MDAFAGLSPRLHRLVMSFFWLHVYRKTPFEMGVKRAELDPVWERAMLEIRAGLEGERPLHEKLPHENR